MSWSFEGLRLHLEINAVKLQSPHPSERHCRGMHSDSHNPLPNVQLSKSKRGPFRGCIGNVFVRLQRFPEDLNPYMTE